MIVARRCLLQRCPQAVLDMLPKLDPAKLPPSYSPGEGVVKKAPPPRPPPDTQTVEYECRWETSRLQA